MYSNKWTVRGVDPESIRKIREVKSVSGGALGELVSEAIDFWFDCLPEDTEAVDEAPEAGTPTALVGHNTVPLETDTASHSLEYEK
jgi:hypothetical protein